MLMGFYSDDKTMFFATILVTMMSLLWIPATGDNLETGQKCGDRGLVCKPGEKCHVTLVDYYTGKPLQWNCRAAHGRETRSPTGWKPFSDTSLPCRNFHPCKSNFDCRIGYLVALECRPLRDCGKRCLRAEKIPHCARYQSCVDDSECPPRFGYRRKCRDLPKCTKRCVPITEVMV